MLRCAHCGGNVLPHEYHDPGGFTVELVCILCGRSPSDRPSEAPLVRGNALAGFLGEARGERRETSDEDAA